MSGVQRCWVTGTHVQFSLLSIILSVWPFMAVQAAHFDFSISLFPFCPPWHYNHNDSATSTTYYSIMRIMTVITFSLENQWRWMESSHRGGRRSCQRQLYALDIGVCVYVRAWVRDCMSAWVHACMRACVCNGIQNVNELFSSHVED